MIVTIDGPAGAGKSSVARKLADALGYEFLDTGAMYRCVTLACMNQGISLSDADRVAEVARNVSIQFACGSVLLDGVDVTDAIREPNISQAIKEVADNLAVRECMVAAQKKWGIGKDAVTEGRDQGTVAFPDAQCKIFLTASAEERARRRVSQLQSKQIAADFESILASQLERDQHDRTRPVGALIAAPDSIHLDTDQLSEEQVLAELIRIVQSKRLKNQGPHLAKQLQKSEACEVRDVAP